MDGAGKREGELDKGGKREKGRNLRKELMEGKGEKGVGDWIEWGLGKEN